MQQQPSHWHTCSSSPLTGTHAAAALSLAHMQQQPSHWHTCSSSPLTGTHAVVALSLAHMQQQPSHWHTCSSSPLTGTHAAAALSLAHMQQQPSHWHTCSSSPLSGTHAAAAALSLAHAAAAALSLVHMQQHPSQRYTCSSIPLSGTHAAAALSLVHMQQQPSHWYTCSSSPLTAIHTVNVSLFSLVHEPFVTERFQTDVFLFKELTSTGTHESVLVLYTDYLNKEARYLLHLNTYNPITNNTGLAIQLIEFSPAPSVENCRITPLANRKGSWFRGSCDEVRGQYYPVLLEWSYSFLWPDKTVFYYGARTSIDFSLPSGLEANDYKVYVSIKAIDGKGVSYKYPVVMDFVVYPRSTTGDGILSIFQEISTIQNESPSLLLQQVRTLAWELNLLHSSDVTQTVFDNILTILFYRTSCKDSLVAADDPSYSSKYSSQNNGDFFVKVNLLKSCARDHLAEIVVELPVRIEMEVLQVLTALQIIADALEYISSITYSRIIVAMQTVATRLWCTYNAEVKTEAAQQYFVLSSVMLDKQFEIYDWNETSAHLSNTVISLLLDVMKTEIAARFLEEEPLTWSTDTLKFHGFLAEAQKINKWNRSVSFSFEPNSIPDGVHLVQSLVHSRSPYNVTNDLVTSQVVNVDLHVPSKFLRQVKVKVQRSQLLLGDEYDFRRPGYLTPQTLSVYEFVVAAEHDSLVLHILLQITKVLNSEYPVAALLLICNSMQSLKEPVYKVELTATDEPSQVSLLVPPHQLTHGKKLLIIMDKNSYENNWARYNSSEIGADFLVSGWWSQCLVWGDNQWHAQNCSVLGKESSWDYTSCSCKSYYSVYGAQAIPILDEESKVNVNELMLRETYLALYFMVLLLVVYFMLALALQTSDRHRLRRRNIWLRDNKPEHEWAYLLTIKTGTQWNAGTTARVYAILHGTHGMSETRELQSKQTGQLFTRGALCTFILTTAEPLGDILKVQLWHDNSGSDSGWYVCETSVGDLVLGARYAYPCYRWLSVQAEDAKVEREITLESPTTFLQDFEHFLPQYASEHMLWTSLLTTSSTAKLFRLQRLTICLIVCLCMGTVSLGVVQKINTEHTMMVPDMHIESLYYGGIIALLLLPVQWLLEMAFKMSNRLEEKEYNAKAVLDTLRASKEMSPPATSDRNQNGQDDGEDPAHDIYDTNAKIWRNLVNWAQTTELSNLNGELHSALFQGQDNMQVTQRARSEADHDLGSAELMSNTHETPTTTTLPANITRIINHQHEVTNTKKCSPTILSFFSELRKTFNYILHFVAKNRRSKSKKRNKLEEDGWDAEEDVDDDDDDDDLESDELGVTSSITFIFSQCVGWIVCCFFAALCCMVLFVRGSGMPMDYGSLWIHIIYITLCFSVFIMQPLVVVIYTLYKVCMYRWLGCRGCISSCVTIPLDQVVAIWNRYQAVLLEQVHSANIMDSEKLLEERQRTRELRYSHPPSEDYLLKCREKEMRKENVSSLFCNSIGHLLLLTLLIIIASSVNVEERYRLNWSIYSSLENGSCLESARFVDACKSIGSNSDSCNQQKDKTYMGFKDIKSKEDWWKWAYSELLALTYNSDKTFSQYNIFCDSNSIIIGMPRIRKYDIGSEECDASKVKISNNRSMADLLRVKTCFPNYVDEVAHLFSFKSTKDKEYEWDAHFLAITYGQYGHYSYTSYKQSLATSRFSSLLMLMVLQSSNWIDENTTRAVVTDFALYHPQTQLYTAVTLLAEFPSLSGVKVKTSVWSTHIERYSGMLWSVCMLAEIILLAVAMHYLNKAVIYIHTCRFRIWKSFWGILDIFMTIVSWSYIVCLMLRVDIAEDALWQLRVAYFQKFVNLKGLTTWDNILHALIGIMLMLHLLRCLCLMQYLPRLRYLGLMLATATKDVSVISIALGILVMACMLLGHMWFSPVLWEFHTLMQTLLTLFRMTWLRLDFLKSVEHESRYTKFLGYLFYLIIYVFLYQVARALFASAFLNVRKSHVYKPGLDVKWEDLVYYVKERSRSVLQMFFRKKEDDKDQPEDNTPPDFYMTELDLQITQVMAGLENVGETLGLVVNRIDELMEEDEPGVDTWDDYGILKDMHTDDAVWQPEQNKSCTQKTEPEAILKLLHNRVGADSRKQSLMSQVLSLEGRLENMKGEEGDTNTTPIKPLFNLDAFTDIASCQTEIEALTRNWNMTAFEQTEYRTQDDGGRLAKFLKDVSAASDENVTSFGKYGKTVGKLKVNPKLQPSDESLRTVHNRYNPSSTLETRRIGHMQSLVTSQHRMLATESQHHGTHAFQTDTPAQGPIGISSRLCRTQTQGRGKGHVDVLDIVSLESDSESDSSS
nr:uncharacterized protein LOC128704203 [Cherax quadricarinatus]